jgi:hypothetical protein
MILTQEKVINRIELLQAKLANIRAELKHQPYPFHGDLQDLYDECEEICKELDHHQWVLMLQRNPDSRQWVDTSQFEVSPGKYDFSTLTNS